MHPESEERVEAALLRQVGCMRALARSLVANAHDADDVVQDAWIAVLRRRGHGVLDARAWTAGLVRNLASKLRRRELRRRARELASGAAAAPPAPPPDHADTLDRVTRAVVSLREPYRSTVLARYFEGLTPRAIGMRDGVPVATVKSRLRRALAELRGRLDAEHGGDRRAWIGALLALGGLDRTAAAAAAFAIGVVMKPKYLISAVALALVGGIAFCLSEPLREPTAGGAPPPPSYAAVEPAGAAVAPRAATASGPGPARTAIPTTGTLRGLVLWSNGTEPAAGVGVSLVPWGSRHPRIDRVEARTDDAGRFVVSGLPPGVVGVYGDRSGYATVVVVPGETCSTTIRFGRGLTLEGAVVDASGAPVAGAEIWMSDAGNGTRGAIATRADAAGRFVIRDITDQSCVCARHTAHGPSWACWVEGAPGSTIGATLVLGERGGAVDVVVVDDRDRPVRGAAVRVVSGGTVASARPHGTDLPLQRPIPYHLTTGADGRVAADCVTPGPVEVVVAAHDGAPAKRTIQLAPGAREECLVRLDRGVSVRGTVRDPDGDPLGGITVRVGGYGDIDSRQTTSSADGRFELHGIAAGELPILAAARDAGKVTARLRGADGDVLEWNPVIEPGRTLAGTLIDERGAPLADWKIDVHGGEGREPGGFWGQTRTADDGSFRVVGCPAGELRVQAVDTRRDIVFADGVWRGVVADGVAREFRMPDSSRPSAFLDGRAVAASGVPVAVRILLCRADRERPWQGWCDAATGRFRIGPLAPGRYTVIADFDGAPAEVSGIELAADEVRRLGDIGPPAAGSVRVDVAVPRGVDPERIRVRIDSLIPGDRRDPVRVTAARRDAIELSSGRYRVDIGGPVLPETHEITVEAGRTAVLAVAPEVAARVALSLRAPAGEPLPDRVEVTVQGPGGEPLGRSSEWPQAGQLVLLVPPDRDLSLELRAENGLHGRCTVGPLPPMTDARPGPPRIVELWR